MAINPFILHKHILYRDFYSLVLWKATFNVIMFSALLVITSNFLGKNNRYTRLKDIISNMCEEF